MGNQFEGGSTASGGGKVENKPNNLIVIDHLSNLLEDGNLNVEKIKQGAKELGIDGYKICFKIIEKLKLGDNFFSYCKEIGEKGGTNLSREEILFNFFEKIQHKPDPAKVEQEPQVVDIPVAPVAPVAPVIIPEEEPRPTVAAPQKVEVPVTPVAPKKVEVPTVKPIPATKTVESIPKSERKDWWEVKRETEVMAIEDLDGIMNKFKEHVKKLGVAKKDGTGYWRWMGGDKKLVFLGDILGDRNMDGIEITNTIFDLADQAEKMGGQVDFLCGNHDEWFIYFLCHAGGSNYGEKVAGDYTGQASDIWELLKFDSDPRSELRGISPKVNGNFDPNFERHETELWQKLYDKMPAILTDMRTHKDGRRFLENICNMKVAIIHDDTLFCHTDPTMRMIADLTKDNNIAQRVVEVNGIFQKNLRKALFDGAKLGNDFNLIRDIYLDTGNREYFVEKESFESLAKNLLVKLIENLYKNKKIEFDPEIEENFGKKGFLGFKWYEWKNYLSYNLKSFNTDDLRTGDISDSIERWKMDNGLVGDFISEVDKIFDQLIEARKISYDQKKANAELEVVANLIESLAEKIKKLNPVEINIQKVRNLGINAIIHGHTYVRDREQYYDGNGLIIVSPHLDILDGISKIDKGGKIDLIKKSFREK